MRWEDWHWFSMGSLQRLGGTIQEYYTRSVMVSVPTSGHEERVRRTLQLVVKQCMTR